MVKINLFDARIKGKKPVRQNKKSSVCSGPHMRLNIFNKRISTNILNLSRRQLKKFRKENMAD